MPRENKDEEKKLKIKASSHDSYGVMTIIAVFIPVVGIILGIVYLTKEKALDRKLGEHLIAFSILMMIILGLAWTMFAGSLFPQTAVVPTTSISSPPIVPPAPTWDIEGSYAKITNGMTRDAVESAIAKTASHCTEQEIGQTKYDTCNYGEMADGGTIMVSYTDGVVANKQKIIY